MKNYSTSGELRRETERERAYWGKANRSVWVRGRSGLNTDGAMVAAETDGGDGALGVRHQRRRHAAAGRAALLLPHRG
jgi:hypothetical protein